jgi:hypothetical protein
MVLSRVKAFTDTFVGGDGGGAVVAPFSLLGAPLGGTIFLPHRALEGENLVHLWACDDSAIGVVPLLEVSHLEFRLGQAVVVVGWWCCPRAAAEEVRFVRAAREVQRTHGCWWS